MCHSQVTDPIVITLGQVDTKGHHNRIVSAGTIVVWDFTKTDTIMNADMAIEQIMIVLAVDTTIDNGIEICPGAGRAAGQLTQEGHTALTTAGRLRTAGRGGPAVQANIATGTTTEIDAISLTEVEVTLAGSTRWRSPP